MRRRDPRPGRPSGVRDALLERYRWWTAGLAGGGALVLGSLYGSLDDTRSRGWYLLVIFMFSFLTVLLTFSVLHPEAEFRGYQPWVSSTAGGVAGVLGTIANGVHGEGLAAVLVAGFVLGTVAVLYTRPTLLSSSDRTVPAPAVEPPVAAPARLPRRQGTFCGRAEPLRVLHERHRRAVSQLFTSDYEDAGPTVLLLHGMPGVGKSALALEFAHQIAESYVDGQLHANLGLAGNARSEADVLADLLTGLGRSAIPPTTSERAQLFRSMTAGKRLLVVLDAARSVQQVQQLLPNSDSCTVLVTSRQDFGPALGRASLHVRPPDAADARRILRTFARVDAAGSPVCTATVVDVCGRLPIALRAAGELAATEPAGLCAVAVRLREADRRLDVLETSRWSITGGFAAEYDQLPAREQAAFRLLSLVPAQTFTGWTLCPLLAVDTAEAGNLLAQLSAAQLVEVVTPPDPSGLVRYRFHPLVREFAAGLVAAGDAADRLEALRAAARLKAASLAVTARVLAAAEPAAAGSLVVAGEQSWLPADSPWPGRIAALGHRWLRTEHVSLVHVVHTAAAKRRWQVCWRVAARLGDCLPEDLAHARTEQAFDLGLAAAQRVGEAVGEAEVGLAKAAYLTAVESYQEAFATLDRVDRVLAGRLTGNGDTAVARLACRVQRLRIEASMQMAAYRTAREALADALHRAEAAGDPLESKYLAVLQADLAGLTDPEHWLVELPYRDAPADAGDDSWVLRTFLGGAEAARRRQHWADATDLLDAALAYFAGDARRTAAILFRRGRQAWHRSRAAADDADRRRYADEAVGWLADAVVTFDRMGNTFGGLRARCAMVRALVAAGRLDHAEEQLAAVDRAVDQLGPPHGPAHELVDARRGRATGELLLATGRRNTDACQFLERAVDTFAGHDDWWSAADTRVLLGRASREAHRPEDAMTTLWAAASTFRRCGDGNSLARALHEISATAGDMGYPGAARDFARSP